jgi:putative PIN family toxin of toxin-antitoxin system
MNTSRVVLDINILVSAMLSPLGNPAKVFKMFLTQTLHLVFSADMLAEYEDVLYRPRLHIPRWFCCRVERRVKVTHLRG